MKGGYKGLPRVTRGYRGLQGISKGNMGLGRLHWLQGVTKR